MRRRWRRAPAAARCARRRPSARRGWSCSRPPAGALHGRRAGRSARSARGCRSSARRCAPCRRGPRAGRRPRGIDGPGPPPSPATGPTARGRGSRRPPSCGARARPRHRRTGRPGRGPSSHAVRCASTPRPRCAPAVACLRAWAVEVGHPVAAGAVQPRQQPGSGTPRRAAPACLRTPAAPAPPPRPPPPSWQHASRRHRQRRRTRPPRVVPGRRGPSSADRYGAWLTLPRPAPGEPESGHRVSDWGGAVRPVGGKVWAPYLGSRPDEGRRTPAPRSRGAPPARWCSRRAVDLARAVEVAGPGDEQPEPARHLAQPGPRRRRVVAVVDLEAREPRLRQPAITRVADVRRATGARVRHHGGAAGRPTSRTAITGSARSVAT